MKQQYEVVKPCINQDTKKKLEPGDLVDNLSAFEKGRHLAEGNIVPHARRKVDKAIDKPPETRRRGRRKKNESD